MKGKSKKDFYTTQELTQEEWFPVKSSITIKKLIERGELEAIDVSTNPDFKRYRISRKSVDDFMERRKGNKK